MVTMESVGLKGCLLAVSTIGYQQPQREPQTGKKNLILEVNFIHPVRRRNIRLIHWWKYFWNPN